MRTTRSVFGITLSVAALGLATLPALAQAAPGTYPIEVTAANGRQIEEINGKSYVPLGANLNVHVTPEALTPTAERYNSDLSYLCLATSHPGVTLTQTPEQLPDGVDQPTDEQVQAKAPNFPCAPTELRYRITKKPATGLHFTATLPMTAGAFDTSKPFQVIANKRNLNGGSSRPLHFREDVELGAKVRWSVGDRPLEERAYSADGLHFNTARAEWTDTISADLILTRQWTTPPTFNAKAQASFYLPEGFRLEGGPVVERDGWRCSQPEGSRVVDCESVNLAAMPDTVSFRVSASATGFYKNRMQLAVIDKEAAKIEARLAPDRQLIVMAIEGKTISSEELATTLDQYATYGQSKVTFIIGGSLGVSNRLKQRANHRISFGRITLPHQLMRLVLVEQIYRAFRINAGHSYHK